ncbi:MAG: DUF1829 domain-containing protein [Thermoguttaceae bacterium]
MSYDIKQLTDGYFRWLKDNTSFRNLEEGWTEIATPFLDRHNDGLQIYAKPEKNGVRLSDDGYIIDDLIMSGCSLDSPKRKGILKEILAGFGVENNDRRLEVFGSFDQFPHLKHNLLQAMLSVNDLFYLSSAHIASLFFEDVLNWLDTEDIRYTPNVEFRGKSGFNHSFHGVIPKSRKSPERVFQTINHPDKNEVQRLIFKWNDTKENRESDSILYPVLNDVDNRVSVAVVEAFDKYNIKSLFWSQRNEYKEMLSA